MPSVEWLLIPAGLFGSIVLEGAAAFGGDSLFTAWTSGWASFVAGFGAGAGAGVGVGVGVGASPLPKR